MSTRATNQPRQPRGVPTGGQWRATARPAGPALSLREDHSAYELAVAALRWGDLPDNFDWSVTREDGWTVAHEAARHGALPTGFDCWDLTDGDGATVAHVAARYGYLPENFDCWDLTDADGATVAHVAAQKGYLPQNFTWWYVMDNEGWTVAHVAAAHGHLPPGFDRWDLVPKRYHPRA